MRVGIVIPAYNSAAYIAETIESVKAQTFTNWDCVIVDDGSTDSTLQIAQESTSGDSRFTVTSQPNSGAANARNRGFKALPKGTEFVIFLDNDDIWLPDCLEVLIHAIEQSDDITAVHGLAFINKLEESYISQSKMPVKNAERFELINGQKTTLAPNQPTTLLALIWDNVITTTGLILIRRTAFEKAGGFEQAMFPLDDWDLYMKLTRIGKIAFVNRPVIMWRVHESNTSGNQQLMDEATQRLRNRICLMPNLTAEERDCANRRYLQSIRSTHRHIAAHNFRQARRLLMSGPSHFCEAVRCFFAGIKNNLHYFLLCFLQNRIVPKSR